MMGGAWKGLRKGSEVRERINHFTFGQGGDAMSRNTSRVSASNTEEEPGNRIVGTVHGR